MDGGGIDIWKGTDEKREIDGIICIVDLLKKILKSKYWLVVQIMKKK